MQMFLKKLQAGGETARRRQHPLHMEQKNEKSYSQNRQPSKLRKQRNIKRLI